MPYRMRDVEQVVAEIAGFSRNAGDLKIHGPELGGLVVPEGARNLGGAASTPGERRQGAAQLHAERVAQGVHAQSGGRGREAPVGMIEELILAGKNRARVSGTG